MAHPPRRAERTTASDDNGGIRINKNLTIQGNTGKTSDMLDADGKNRIFSVANGKTLTLKNLTLENGSGDYGGGIRADSNCTLTMTGCILKGNKVNRLGGGIYASATTITMKDCTLTGNEAHESNVTASGGVIYAENSTVTIEGGSIVGSKAGYANNANYSDGSGGGLYISNSTTLTLKNCTVTGNTAQEKGGSVYVTGNNAKLIMEESTTITPAADKNDVYLDNNNMITVDDALTKTTPVARITVPDDKYLPSTKVLAGSAASTEYSKFTVTPQSTPPTIWSVGSDGKLKTP